MKQKLDLNSWNRKEHYHFFKEFDEPYYGVTVKLDCTRAYLRAKELGVSFFNYYLHKTLIAVNAIENFRYRIENKEVYIYDCIDASATVLRADHTFGFSYMKYFPDFELFNIAVKEEIARVKSTSGLFTAENKENIIHFSALPWLDFTSVSQASKLKSGDSCPKFSIGKLVEENGKKQMPFGLHVHHALVDGFHLGLFFEKLQVLLNE
ncbi:chloramphenicol O-acetyltransferase type A [Pedobacter sp. CG_S7]|uniref:chloramphenicol acetyltransferase n=1 Tax=Pedobacter sp. CG_S7 TaxID=3143930 RepID=UPI00339845D2